MKSSKMRRILAIAVTSFLLGGTLFPSASSAGEDDINRFVGGGYAVSGQIKGVGYTEEIYDATNGLPTSDANVVYASSDGYIWVGGYSGILRFDGNTFERMDSRNGLTSGRCIFEDKDNRMWSELKTWKLILSILSPFVESLEDAFRFPPFEFMAE